MQRAVKPLGKAGEMIKRRGISRRSAAVAAIATVGVVGGIAGQALAQTQSGALTTSKGGYRDVANNAGTGYAIGLPGAVMEASTSTAFGTTTPFPATDANGNTSLGGLIDNTTYYVREKTSPAGWETLGKLNWRGSEKDYIGSRRYENDEVKAVRVDDGANGDVEHRFVNRLANPGLPTTCGVGIKVLLLLDTSGSTSGYNDQYNTAAKTFINTLGGTPTSLKISSFATTSSPGNTVYDLSTGGGQASAAAAVDAIYPNNTSGSGSTNWDAALQDAATADVDVIVFVTDGNPTVNQGDLGTGSSTSIDDITFGVASANLAKNPSKDGGKKQTMVAVGVGRDLAVENLKAVSGPTEGSDWTTAEDPSELAATLKKIAESICPADLAIEKTGDTTVAPDGTISYELKVTNKGTGDIPFGSIVVKDDDVDLKPPDPAPDFLKAGESAIWTATRKAGGGACGTEVSNTGKVSLDLTGYEEQDLTNNESTWKTLVVCPVDLSIAKKGDAEILPGGVIKYSIAVTNDGMYDVPFTAIEVGDEDADPDSLKFEAPDPAPDFLKPGESATWVATRTVGTSEDLCGTDVDNTATVALMKTPGYVEEKTDNNSSTIQTRVICPLKVSIGKTSTNGPLEPGQLATYDVVVTNSGDFTVPFTDIVVDDPGADLTPPDPAPEALKPGESATWKASRTVPLDQACGSQVENTASVSLGNGAVPAAAAEMPNGTSATAYTDVICPVDVSITKTTGQATVEPGGTVSYDVTVTNPSNYPVPFSSIVVTDAGSTLTPPADTSDLAPGASRTWTATLAVPSDAALCGTAVSNTADVDLAELPPGVIDADVGASSATSSGVTVAGGICTPAPPVTPVTPAAAPVTAFRPATPTLAITKTGQRRAIAGGRVIFRVRVTNTGSTTATNVVLTDTPARSMLWQVLPRGAKVSGRTATWKLGDLAPGRSVSKIVRMRMRISARGRSCNVATVTAAEFGSRRARACVRTVTARRPVTPVTG